MRGSYPLTLKIKALEQKLEGEPQLDENRLYF